MKYLKEHRDTINKEINELIGDNDIEEKTHRKDIVAPSPTHFEMFSSCIKFTF